MNDLPFTSYLKLKTDPWLSLFFSATPKPPKEKSSPHKGAGQGWPVPQATLWAWPLPPLGLLYKKAGFEGALENKAVK